MAVLLLISSQRNRYSPELNARISDNDITAHRVANIHELLQSLHRNVFRRLRASIYTFVSELALLCRRIFERSRKLFDMRHLYNLHLHSDSSEALPMSHHGPGLLDSI